MLMTLIGRYWLQIGIVIAVAVLLGTIKYERHEVSVKQQEIIALNATIDGYRAISEQQKQENDRIQQGSTVATTVTMNSYESKLKQLKDYYEKHPNERLVPVDGQCVFHDPMSSSDPASPQVSDSTSGAHETSTDTSNPGEDQQEYQLTEKDCAETTLQLESLQQWITAQQNNWNQR